MTTEQSRPRRDWTPAARTREFVRSLREERDIGGAILAAIALGFTVLSLLLPVSSAVANVGMARFHRTIPFEAWASLQPWPAMYNFENMVLVGTTRDPHRAPEAVQLAVWVNHHITVRITSMLRGQPPMAGAPCQFFMLISQYRGQEMRTAYLACPTSESAYHVAEFQEETREP